MQYWGITLSWYVRERMPSTGLNNVCACARSHGLRHNENGRKKSLHSLPRPFVGTCSFVHRGLKLVQLVKTEHKHERFIEDLGDLGSIYVHPIVLWDTCKAQ